MSDRLQTVQALFEEVADLAPEKRRAHLLDAAGGDEALVHEVEELLRHDQESDDSLLISVQDQAAATLSDRPRRETIGKYRVVRELGQGGMGTVYLATRDDEQYRKEVAIKLVPAVVARDELMRRFRAERQIMASLEHPNIARLLDGDTTRDGIPYVVMEYVQGQPIDAYCAERKLSTREKLKLFLKVCDAISHAHRNLVVHRDIKPGNILVTEDGEPKLLDFGIAKILAPDDDPMAGSLTKSSMRLMTPEYASPEQARGDPVSTASDVYSLGVLLYRLLTDRLPYALDTTKLGELERIICEQAPLAPGAVESSVAGELSDIVLMALRKEPQRRYPSVEAFAEDLRRFLANRPVAARPDTTGYRVAKFLRRNRLAAVAATIISASVIVGLVVANVGLMRAQEAEALAREEAEISQSVTQSFIRLFDAADQYAVAEGKLTVEELLEQGVERITENTRGRPVALATILADLAAINQRAGLYSKSVELYDQAAAALLAMDDPPKEQLFHIYHDLLWPARYTVDIPEGEERVQRLTDWQETWFPDSNYHRAIVLNVHALMHSVHRRYEDAIESLLEVERLRQDLEQTPGEQARLLMTIAEYYLVLEDTNEGIGYLDRGIAYLDRAEALFAEDPERSPALGAELYRLLGVAHVFADNDELALAYAEQALALSDDHFTDQSPVYRETLTEYAWVQMEAGQLETARAAINKVLGYYADVDLDSPELSYENYPRSLGFAADIEMELGNYAAAEDMKLRALELARRLDGDGSPIVSEGYVELAVIANRAGREAAALDYLAQAVEHNYRFDDLWSDSEFDNLRDDARFQELMRAHQAYLQTLAR